ncbi:MAG: hypothetical protein SGI92_21840, partial [Bryobacteraceae bacterium]|nr:hypothetical protein [Bryobacteraceae bacterium]
EEGKALEAIRRGGWDVVCLQEHSLLGNPPAPGAKPAVNDPAAYFEYAAKFAAEIAAAGARPVLYATWAREDFPEQQRRLDDAFMRVAREIRAAVVPVGLAWTITRIEAPDIRLYTPDRSHPTQAGSYLAALLFYQTITGQAPVGTPAVISGTPWNSQENVRLVNLTLSDALSLRMYAARAWEQEPLNQWPAP